MDNEGKDKDAENSVYSKRFDIQNRRNTRKSRLTFVKEGRIDQMEGEIKNKKMADQLVEEMFSNVCLKFSQNQN